MALIEALAKNPQAAARAGDTLRFATSAILKSGEPARIERVLALAAANGTPEWARSALLAGLRHFLPRSPGGRSVPGTLPAEPKPLLALAANRGAAASSIAAQLLNQLKWPGKPGAATALARPLIYSRWVLGDPRLVARIVLTGKIQENLVMPPWKAALDDEAIAGVLTVIRRSWGHETDPVAAATVAEARKDTATREEPFSDADLKELAQSLGAARK